MKRFLSILLTLSGSLLGLGAETLEWTGSNVSIYADSFVYPIRNFGIEFNDSICVSDNPMAVVLCGNDTIAVATGFVADNEISPDLSIHFDTYYPPLGQNYIFHVAEGTVYKCGSPSVVNEAINIPFHVPENLGTGRVILSEEILNLPLHEISIVWDYPIDLTTSDYVAVIYREGLPIYKFPLFYIWDFDSGVAGPEFYNPILESVVDLCFEKDVNYRLVIPEGVIWASPRHDLINEEVNHEFSGGWTGSPSVPLEYQDLTLYREGSDRLDSISFRYDRMVQLTLVDQGIELWEESNGSAVLVESVVPNIIYDNGSSTITADFGGFVMNESRSYYIKIPYSLFVTSRDIITVNDVGYIPVGVSELTVNNADESVRVEKINGSIAVSGKNDSPIPVMVYSTDGKVLINKEKALLPLTLEVPDNSIYIVKAGSKLYRIR